MYPRKFLNIISMWIFSGFLLGVMGPVEAKNKEKWENIPFSSFPAIVKTIILQNKKELKSGDSFKVGNWTIKMTRERHIARASGDYQIGYIDIKGFYCSNPFDGGVNCTMHFNDQRGPTRKLGNSCLMFFSSKLSNIKHLGIPCPRDLILETN